jgi:hypothetical protein
MYMATRAYHSNNLKINDIIKKGPARAERKIRRGVKGVTFPFGITLGFGKRAHGSVQPEEPDRMLSKDEPPKDDQGAPDNPNDERPDTAYLCRVLYSRNP